MPSQENKEEFVMCLICYHQPPKSGWIWVPKDKAKNTTNILVDGRPATIIQVQENFSGAATLILHDIQYPGEKSAKPKKG